MGARTGARRAASLLMALVASLVCCATSASGQQRLVDITGGLYGQQGSSNVSQGYSFTLTNPLIINGLGMLAPGEGLGVSHYVGLWTDTGTLMVQTTVTNASTIQINTGVQGTKWLFDPFGVPIYLSAGTYVLSSGNTVGSLDGSFLFSSSQFSGGAVFGVAYSTQGNPNAFPTSAQPQFGQGVFGPNLLIAPAYWKGGFNGTWTGVNWTIDADGSTTTVSGFPVSPVGVNVIFSALGAANQGSTTLEQNFSINSLTVTDALPVVISSGAGGPYTLTIGNQDGIAIKVNAGSDLTIDANVLINTAGNGIDATGIVTINGIISGTNGISKSGAGELQLTNALNDYTGGTAFNGGVTIISSNGALGSASGPLSFNGGTLHTLANITMNRDTTLNAGGGTFWVDYDTTLTQQGLISGVGKLTMYESGTLVLTNANNTYEGGTEIVDGTISISSNGNLGLETSAITFNGVGGGRLLVTADVTMDRTMTFAGGNGRVEVATGATLTQAGQLVAGAGVFYKAGGGTLVLTGSSTFDSYMTIDGGTFAITGADASLDTTTYGLPVGSSAASHVLVSAGGELSTRDADLGVGATGTATVTGANSVWNANYFTVGRITPGELEILDGGAVNASRMYIGSISTGEVTVSGPNSTLSVPAGILIAFDSGGSGTLTIENGGKVTTNQVEMTNNANSSTGQLTVNGSPINGRGVLETGGILKQNATRTALVDINGGILRATGNNPTFLDGFAAGEITLGSGGVIIDTQHYDIGISSPIDGSGGIEKTGTGTLTFNGSLPNSFSGTTTVASGTLVLNKGVGVEAVPGDLDIGTVTAATVRLEKSGQTTSTTDVTMSFGSVFDLNDRNTSINSLSMSGATVDHGLGILTLHGDLTTYASISKSLFTSSDLLNHIYLLGATRTFTVADGFTLIDLDIQAGIVNGTLVKEGAGLMRLAGLQNDNLSVTLNNGRLALASDAALGRTFPGGMPTTFTLAGGTVMADGGDRTIFNTINLTGNATIGASVDGTPRALSFLGSMSLTGSRTLTVNNDAATTFGTVHLLGNTLTLDGTGHIGVIDAITGNGGSLDKYGTNTLTLTGASTYTGGTTIRNGTLTVNNTTGSATGSGAVLIKTGATLSGAGTINGVVTLEGGANLAPGNSPGILTVGELNLDAATRLHFELGLPYSVPGFQNDVIAVIGNINGSGASGNLHLGGVINLTTNGDFGTGTYTLINYGGTLSGSNGSTMTFGSAPAGYNLVVETSTANEVRLIVNYDGLQFWDGSNSDPGLVANGRGGDGTWNTTNTNWTNQSGNANNNWKNLTAVFAGTAGTVQVAGTGMQIAGLHFKTDGYTLADAGGSLDVGSGAELRIDPSVSATIEVPLIGTGGITKTGDGTIILSGTNTYEGGTKLNAGTLSISKDANLGATPAAVDADNLNFNGGTLQVTESFTLHANRGITLTGAGRVEVALDKTLEYSGSITGNGALTKAGAGTLTLLGASNFISGTTISAGTLHLGDGQTTGAILGTGKLVIDDAGTFVLNLANGETFFNGVSNKGVFIATGDTGENYSIASLITGTGTFEKTGSNTVTLLGQNDYSGGTTINGGNLVVGDGTTTGIRVGTDLVTIDTDGTLTLRLANGDTFANAVKNSGHFIADGTSGADFTISTAITGTGDFEKTGANTVTLTGANNYSGGTTISGGVLQIGDGTTNGSIIGNVLNNASMVFHRSDDVTFDGVISGSGSVTKQNTNALTLTGANSYAGGTTINSGKVVTTHSTALGTGPVTLNTGAILAPTGVLQLGSLTWNGGEIALNPKDGDLLQITGAFTNGGDGGTFILGALELGVNKLATFGSTDFTIPVFISANPDVDYNVYAFFLNGTSLQLNAVSATATGPLLQNSGPVYIPTFADFTVNGRAWTGTPTENNIINSLIFLPGSSLQVFNNLTVTSGNFTVTGGKAIISGGSVIVPGDFHKFGAGILDSRTAFQVEGNALIHGGALSVNGTFQTPLLQVLPNGTLMGNGIVIGNVVNAGTVAPGNSIGLLTIRGNYRQTSSGTLEIEVASPGNHDVLVVSGHARLGGTLEIASLGYKPKYGDQIPFLKAGRITGKFNRIEMPNPSVNRGRFLNLGNLGVLIVAPTSYTLVATTSNETRVARALDEWIGIEEGDIGETTLALDLLREEHYPQAFQAIMPGFHDAALSTGIELSHSQGQLLHQQLSARRLGQRTLRSEPAQLSASAGPDGKGSKNVLSAQPQVALASDERWSTWFQGSGLFSQGGLSLTPGEDFESGNFLVGADYALSEHVALGIFAAYGEGWGDYDNGGEIDLERVTFGGYATVDIENFYLNAAFGVGTVDYDIKRPIQFATLSRNAHSDPDGTEFFGLLGGGYDVQQGNWTFGPQVSVQYSRIALDSFTEHGADSLDLRMDAPEAESLRSYLGARVAYTVEVNDRMAIIPELRAFWQHEFLDGEDLHARLDGGNGPGFLYEPEGDDKDALYLGAGIGFQIGPRFYGNVYYNVDLGREEPNHNVSLSATLRF
ncbi:autotransporter domain-containing protein [Roseimicrobium sp. ORNL1]|uniref:autotransporter domain-containing protein n=1 Tax=Roseimicrobium sp. ORNL1 TaxID=2711231 RepID=UPI0013E1DD78|nr:autotransporter domain-containing protein [Roseimicrobium sp. ORNL1]QIF03676.1 autotransporter domain-containing protein [Roseimicrobium sp. ORNL1]